MTENTTLNTTKKVFIFDDNLEILELCTEILRDIGCEVKTSPTTNGVVEQVAAWMPDLILMDNWLPDITGVEATRLIKADERLKHIPVIYFSANSDIDLLAKEAGANDFLAKPFDIMQFEETIREYTGLP
ncbi:MAG TPA: response regulator [Chryseobacterium sp.]|nr:response regulator [Chryseobacterium sp.]